MTYFELRELNLAKANVLKAFECNRNGNRRDKVALRTTSIKNVKLKIIKTRTGCQYIGYFYSVNLNWVACGPGFGHNCVRLINFN